MGIAEVPRNEELALRVDTALDAIRGNTIREVRRIFYVAQGRIERERGGLELVMRDGVVINLDSGSDGEVLVAELQPWVDPFEGPRSADAEEWIRTAGKWTAFDVSDQAEYAPLIGSVVVAADLRCSEWRKPTGVILFTPTRRIIANTEWDEFEVRIESPDSPMV